MLITASRSGDVESTLDDVVRGLRKAQRDVGKTVAKVARSGILADVKVRRGTLTMSRMGPRARLNVTSRIDATATSTTVELVARPAGMWAIAEYGTRPHRIRAHRGTGGLFIPGIGFAEYVDHPGSHGGHYWQHATAVLDDELADDITRVFDDALEVV